jgi:uncharacterized membrane protein YagU involved in acid resistance
MKSAFAAVLLGGLVAGTIDIGAAALINGRDVVFILHAIAGGLLGLASFKQGAGSAVAGLLLQWAMSLVIAGIYVFAAMRISALKRLWIAGGLAYGVGIFFVMNYVVVPLSAYHSMPDFTPAKFAENMAAMLLFGLIVAFFARRVSAR